ncbi:MAG: hypothetical protein ABI651_20130 [Verrucomicrobiota bacterium]
MAFIKITDSANHAVYINVDHIVTVEQDGIHSRIDVAGDSTRDKQVMAKESSEQVMELIAEAAEAGA